MEGFLSRLTPWPRTGWAIWYRGRAVVILDEVIAQIRAAPTETLGWFEEELGLEWKHLFLITTASIRTGDLPLDHNAWNLMPNPWWKFLTNVLKISLEAIEELNRQRRPSVVPHWDESERKLVDFWGKAMAHMGNYPTLKLVQLMAPV
nr:hypothetical protein CFP56_15651 [Quercus suber]